jgi:Lon protease-like protein
VKNDGDARRAAAAMSDSELPLFPLATVLMPGGPLMLRIFESRYVDMVGRCMREDSGFAVVLIHRGGETGPVTFHDVATLAKIVDWHQYEDGLLGITSIGQRRVRILESHRQADGLNVGRVEAIAADPAVSLPERFDYMSRLLRQLIGQLGDQYRHVEPNYADAAWVGYRLAEILPLADEQKQTCLEMNQPLDRLQLLAEAIKVLSKRNSL